jgi:hypothetical protein
MAHQLEDHVAAPIIGELLDGGDPFGGRRVAAHVDDVGGAEPLRQLEPLVEPVDDHDLARAHLPRDRARVDTEPARALHDHRLPGAELGNLQPRIDLRVCAVDAGRHLVGDLGPDLEHGVIRAQVEVLAEAALEVGPHLA